MFLLDHLSPDAQLSLRSDLRVALIGGVFAALFLGMVELAVGQLSGVEAKLLLQESMPTTRFLCSAIMTVSATTLALMLTLLGMTSGAERDVRGGHYERIRQIALMDVVAFIVSTVLLIAHVVPVGSSSAIPVEWYDVIYYTVAIVTSLLGGTLVAVMILLYSAVRDMITTFGPSDDTPLLVDEAPEEEAERAEPEAQATEEETARAADDAQHASGQAEGAETGSEQAT